VGGVVTATSKHMSLLTTASTAHLQLSYELEDVQIFVDMYRAHWVRKLDLSAWATRARL